MPGKAEYSKQLAKGTAGEPISLFRMAIICVHLGKSAEAIDWLEKAFAAHDGNMWSLGVRPTLDPLRSEPRFIGLVQRLGLPLMNAAR